MHLTRPAGGPEVEICGGSVWPSRPETKMTFFRQIVTASRVDCATVATQGTMGLVESPASWSLLAPGLLGQWALGPLLLPYLLRRPLYCPHGWPPQSHRSPVQGVCNTIRAPHHVEARRTRRPHFQDGGTEVVAAWDRVRHSSLFRPRCLPTTLATSAAWGHWTASATGASRQLSSHLLL